MGEGLERGPKNGWRPGARPVEWVKAWRKALNMDGGWRKALENAPGPRATPETRYSAWREALEKTFEKKYFFG